MLSTLDLANLLRRKLAGEPFPYSFIHEVDVCSAPPEDLVRGREQAPGEPDAWYICSPADYHKTAGGRLRRRKRNVRGGCQGERWHPESGLKAIEGPDGEPVGGAYWRTLSYLFKNKNPDGIRKERLGWCMLEIGLVRQGGGAEHLVLCKVYRPRRVDPAVTSPETSLPAVGTPYPVALLAPPCERDNQVMVRNPHIEAEIPSRMAIARKGSAAAAVTDVIDLCGSSILPANRTKDMAKLVLSLENPVVIVSTMGNTATDILLATWEALSCGVREASEIHELAITKQLHIGTINELGLDGCIVSGLLDELEDHLQRVATTKELTPMTRDYLVSFGERTSTKLFSEYLNKLGKETLQEWKLCTVTTFGRAGSALTAATIGKDLVSREIQVWKDQGIFTCDPNVCAKAVPLSCLTFDEAAELEFFSAQSMGLAIEDGISVKVRNLYNTQAETVITKTRDTSESTLTSIALKTNITILDIERTGMLDQGVFVAKAISEFKYFEYLGISFNWVATGEKMSFTLVPSKLLSREFVQPMLDKVVKELRKIATVDQLKDRSAISLIGNPQMALPILGKALNVLGSDNFAVEKVPRGSPKVANVSLVVRDSAAEHFVRVLHSVFFELNSCPVPVPVAVNSPAATAASSEKRKADDDHPEAPPSVRPEQRTDPESWVSADLERSLLPYDENLFEKFAPSAPQWPYEEASLFSNDDLIPFSVPDCIPMTDDSVFGDPQPRMDVQVQYMSMGSTLTSSWRIPSSEPLQERYMSMGSWKQIPSSEPLQEKYMSMGSWKQIPSSEPVQELIPPPRPQNVNGLISVRRGVRSRLCLAISIFQNFEYMGISINWMATSEGKMPLTLVLSKLLSHELIQPALDEAVRELKNIADVRRLKDCSVISLIGNAQLSPCILRKVLSVLGSSPVVIEKVSQGLSNSKVTKVSLVVHGNVEEHCVQVLRSALFENDHPIPMDSSMVPSSGVVSEARISEISDRVRRLAIV